jgi:hypothetical protein
MEPAKFLILVKILPVSHLKERKEKICLNCQAALYGRYCHVCGQENLEPKETVWHLISHFFNDITHFDGKFFSTVKFLLKKPGFLSSEYMAGRRASYLNPIRMYVFTSAIFFIILFSLNSPEDMVKARGSGNEVPKGLPELTNKNDSLLKKLQRTRDDDDREELQSRIDNLSIEIGQIKKLYGDTTRLKFGSQELSSLLVQGITDTLREAGISLPTKKNLSETLRKKKNPTAGSDMFGLNQGRYGSVGEYDSAERALPDSLRDGWFKNKLMRKLIDADEKYTQDGQRARERFVENMLHSFPKILFFSLPFFALILNMLYFRRKQYYYVDHGIFAIHVYCATFILLLVAILVSDLGDWVNTSWFKVVTDWLVFGISIYMLIFLYKSMRGFYKQGRGKTFLKYAIACFLAMIVNTILLAIFLFVSAIMV